MPLPPPATAFSIPPRELFYRDGYRATGIDKIIAESGVAKMSLYRHFASKNDLISAFLARRHDNWMAWFAAAVRRRLAERAEPRCAGRCPRRVVPVGRLPGLRLHQRGGRGRRRRRDDPRLAGHAVEHKKSLAEFVANVARELKLSDPDAVAEEAMVCIEGMIVRYQMVPDVASIDAGRRLLARLHAAG